MHVDDCEFRKIFYATSLDHHALFANGSENMTKRNFGLIASRSALWLFLTLIFLDKKIKIIFYP